MQPRIEIDRDGREAIELKPKLQKPKKKLHLFDRSSFKKNKMMVIGISHILAGRGGSSSGRTSDYGVRGPGLIPAGSWAFFSILFIVSEVCP